MSAPQGWSETPAGTDAPRVTRTPDQEDAVTYLRSLYSEQNPTIGGHPLTKAEANEFFTIVADAFVAGRAPKVGVVGDRAVIVVDRPRRVRR